MQIQPGRPRGFVPIGIFFIFGATMAGYAAVTLFRPGTFLDALWALNPRGRTELLPFGKIAPLAFVILSVALAVTSVGWFHERFWGWFLGTAIIAINAGGDLINLAIGEHLKGAVGVVIAGLLLLYMTRSRVRNYFAASLK
ncbi:MAG: hypothetical protein WA609_06855 [Terriglobales bacterium]